MAEGARCLETNDTADDFVVVVAHGIIRVRGGVPEPGREVKFGWEPEVLAKEAGRQRGRERETDIEAERDRCSLMW